MKKFTCLLITLLAINVVRCPCPDYPAAGTNGNPFLKLVSADTTNVASGDNLKAGTADTSSAGVCATGTGTSKLCVKEAAFKAWVNARLASVKSALTGFGAQVSKFGGYLSKVAMVVNYSNLSTAYFASASTELGVTADQAKTLLSYYTNATVYDNEFKAFTGQIETCFTWYSTLYQKVACAGGLEGSTAAPFVGKSDDTVGADLVIKVDACADWATKCNKVWSFIHKVSSVVHVAAYINKKRDTSKTYTVPKFTDTDVYFKPSTVSTAYDVSALITAITNCGSDAAGTNTACTAADKKVLCTSFTKAFDANPIARTSVTFLSTNDPTTSFTANRRALVGATVGTIEVSDTGAVDIVGSSLLLGLPSNGATTLTSTDYSTWSTGYVAPPTGGSSSSSSGSSTKKSAKVVIGTILSALFAIAFLN
jgi:hypothetical protein